MVHFAVSGQYRSKPKFETFEMGILTGLNLSQMDGDYFQGYDKLGLMFGFQGIMNLSRGMGIQIELLYSQKGSRIEHGTVITPQSRKDRIIDLRYAEVPILVRLLLEPKKENTAYVTIGFSVAQRIGIQIIENDKNDIRGTVYQDIKDEFTSREINLVVGLSKYFQRLSLGIRFVYGLTRFYENEFFEEPAPFALQPKEVEFLRNYHLSLYAGYRLFP